MSVSILRNSGKCLSLFVDNCSCDIFISVDASFSVK